MTPTFIYNNHFIFPKMDPKDSNPNPNLDASYKDPLKRNNYIQRVVESFIKNDQKTLNKALWSAVAVVSLIALTALAVVAIPYVAPLFAIPVAVQIVLGVSVGSIGLTGAIASGVKLSSLSSIFNFNHLLDREKAEYEVFHMNLAPQAAG